jgi:hypothetical protein
MAQNVLFLFGGNVPPYPLFGPYLPRKALSAHRSAHWEFKAKPLFGNAMPTSRSGLTFFSVYLHLPLQAPALVGCESTTSSITELGGGGQ